MHSATPYHRWVRHNKWAHPRLEYNELVQRIIKDCSCPRGVAETIASVLINHEETHGESMEYDPVKIMSTYAYYTSIKEAYKDLLGTTEGVSEDEMVDALIDNDFDVFCSSSKDDNGVIIQKG